LKPSVVLFKVAGIAIGVHYTWLFAFAFITWSLAESAYPDLFPRWSAREYWTAGVISAMALFASVMVHELAHSLVALRKGIPVRGITLFIFGGVSNLGEDAKRAWDEFLIAIVGPLTSLVIGGLFFIAFFSFDLTDLDRATVLQGVVFYCGWINITVGIFNLLPGFPLDGGRVLRAITWGLTRNVRTATDVATRVGKLLAWSMIAAGVYFALQGNWLSGVWLALIGFFLSNAAESARAESGSAAVLSGATVREVMQHDPVVVGPGMTVETFISDFVLGRGVRAAPVVDNGSLVGIVSLSDVRRVDAAVRAQTAVSSVMTGLPLHTLAPGESVEAALELLAGKGINQAVVVENGRVAGLVSREALLRFVRLRQELGLGRGRRT
jgi:Zn-dependent protease/CBS domain-containing protein